jgi:hypothetical protein
MVFVKGAYLPKIFCWADVALETIQVFYATTRSERGDSRATLKIHNTQQSTSPPLMNP